MRTLSLVLAGALAAPPPSGAVVAGPQSEAGSSAQALYQAGERAFGVGDFDRAIENFEAAYDASKLIDILYNVALAYVRRFEISGDRKDLLRARAVLRNYVLELESNPSLGSTDDAKALQAEIDKLLGSSPEQGAEAERPARKADGLTIGLGVAGALAGVSLVVAGATGATIARQPFQGARYRAILEAAEKNGVPHGPNDDMCALGADVAAVAEACGRRDAIRSVSIAMLAMSGLLVATAVALGVVRARRAKVSRVSLVVDPLQAFAGVTGRF